MRFSELLKSVSTLVLAPIEHPLRSPTGIFTNHYLVYSTAHSLFDLVKTTFLNPNSDSKGWTWVSDEDVAKCLNYPCTHPGWTPGNEILDVEYRDFGMLCGDEDGLVAVTYYAGKEQMKEVMGHFETYRKVWGDRKDGVRLELWVNGRKVK